MLERADHELCQAQYGGNNIQRGNQRAENGLPGPLQALPEH